MLGALPANAEDAPDKAPSAEQADDDMRTLGYLETAYLGNLALQLRAKLDTGADSSSIHARDVEVYKRGPRDSWVRFRVVGDGGRSIRYDQNVIRFVRIKTKTGGTIRRPVVRMPICVGGVAGSAEINLADRADFQFDALIGREFLAGRIVVDAGDQYIGDDTCKIVDDE